MEEPVLVDFLINKFMHGQIKKIDKFCFKSGSKDQILCVFIFLLQFCGTSPLFTSQKPSVDLTYVKDTNKEVNTLLKKVQSYCIYTSVSL